MFRVSFVLLFVLLSFGCTQGPTSTGTSVRKYPYTASVFEKIESNKKFIINGVYKDYKSPYPGAISSEIACPKEFRPMEFQFSNAKMRISGFILFANQRKAYGPCSRENSAYRVFDGVIHCFTNNMAIEYKYFVEASTPVEHIKSQLEQLDCETLKE